MALCFYALVMNPKDKAPVCRVLRAMSIRGCKREIRTVYLDCGGVGVIYDGNPTNSLHSAKEVGRVSA